jgi:hypothetical protein
LAVIKADETSMNYGATDSSVLVEVVVDGGPLVVGRLAVFEGGHG